MTDGQLLGTLFIFLILKMNNIIFEYLCYWNIKLYNIKSFQLVLQSLIVKSKY